MAGVTGVLTFRSRHLNYLSSRKASQKSKALEKACKELVGSVSPLSYSALHFIGVSSKVKKNGVDIPIWKLY